VVDITKESVYIDYIRKGNVMKIKTNPFTLNHKSNLVEVWLGDPNQMESELILCVDQSLLPSLIASLKSVGK
jgi:hypothetical protein